MRVFITGAAGYVGRAVVRRLVSRGHEVIALVRTPSKVDGVQALGVTEVVNADLSSVEWMGAVSGCEGIVQCATADPFSGRVSTKLVDEVGKRDKEWTLKLLQAGAPTARVFIYSSGAWVYGNRPSEVVHESSPLRPYRAARPKVEGEQIVESEGPKLGYQSLVHGRMGFVYGPGGPWSAVILKPLLAGKRARWIGSGQQSISPVYVDDVASFYVMALEKRPPTGAYNIVDDEPTTIQAFITELTRKMGGKRPGSIPAFVAKLALGLLGEALIGGNRLSNEKARRVVGWTPEFSDHRRGFVQLLKDIDYRPAYVPQMANLPH